MPSLLTFLRPLRYGHAASIALVQTGEARQLPGIVERVRACFPESGLLLLLREEDAALRDAFPGCEVRVVRYAERQAAVDTLKRRRFDVIVLQLGSNGALGLRTLPFALHGRRIIAFNDNLDHFPLNVFRLPILARHFGLASRGSELLLAPFLAIHLLFSVACIHLRGWLRRRSRARSAARSHESSEVEAKQRHVRPDSAHLDLPPRELRA
jgi:hypothetical protein